jgi:hypothetical protein
MRCLLRASNNIDSSASLSHDSCPRWMEPISGQIYSHIQIQSLLTSCSLRPIGSRLVCPSFSPSFLSNTRILLEILPSEKHTSPLSVQFLKADPAHITYFGLFFTLLNCDILLKQLKPFFCFRWF